LSTRFILTLCLLGISFVIKSQDEIITKEYQYDPDPNLKISTIRNDTLYYMSKNQLMKLPVESVVAVRRNYKESYSVYEYMRSNERRIYGIKAGNVFFKADYRFSTDIPEELSKLYYMENYKLYDNIPDEKIERSTYIKNNETGEKIKLPHIKGFYIIFKSDKLHREIKAKIYCTTVDSTQLIVKADISGETNFYIIQENDIESISIQSDGALAGRIAMGVVSRGASWKFYQNKWLNKYQFPIWHLCW
jgi:hypothetical protein